MMQILPGFAPLAARYDGFILDIWGVIHDGIRPLPGALDCLTRLRDAGRAVVLLTNAPRRASAVAKQLLSMGIGGHLYDDIATSGEATHLMLRDRHGPRQDPWFARLGHRVFHLGPERDRNLLEGLDLIAVADPADASFVLNTGPDDHRNPTEIGPFEADLQACAAARLPMICANPDLEVIRGGVRLICAGALALRYQELGGDVASLGKPDPLIYQPILARLALDLPRILAVGDSLRTDMAGARAIGVDGCWVLGGIHADEPDPAGVAAMAGLAPVAAVRGFSW
jgi:HAD superfamily hydrolase (TIGR01459 family)